MSRRTEVPNTGAPHRPQKLDRRRYLRVSGYFARVFLHVLWFDVVLARPVLSFLRSDPKQRWQAIARRYRALAVELGGVLIKLGQFLSARVDVLPLAVARELAGLQDEVPAAPFAAIARQIEEDFARPLSQVFAQIDRQPLGAASLAQAHAARLADGEPVVVKVLRPGIDVLVETDLAAIGLVIRGLRLWRFVRRRIDLDALIREFNATTRAELDLRREGKNVERFAANFADDPAVHAPRVFWRATTRRVLTEENVAYLKIGDQDALSAAGIDRRELAKKLFAVYLRQIFEHSFVHADPHPGNLYVRPRPSGDAGPPFQVIFVDFGMVAEIPERLRASLRRFLIGIATRDAAMVVKASVDAGSLLPGADLVQLEEALDTVFDRFWGLATRNLTDKVQREAGELWREFGRLLLETPIQVQVELMFTGRAVELLSGLAASLDDDFNLWQAVQPFAEKLARETLRRELPDQLRVALEEAQRLTRLPGELSRLATRAERGRLTVRAALASDSQRRLERIDETLGRLEGAVLSAGLVIGGAFLFPTHEKLGGVLLLLAALRVTASMVGRWWR